MGRQKKIKESTDILEILQRNEPETTNESESRNLENQETVIPETAKEFENKTNVEPVQESTKPVITDADIDKALEGFKTGTVEKRGRKPKEPEQPMTLLIPSTMVMSVTDKIMVGGFTALDGMINKKNRIEREMIKQFLSLSPEQQKELAPMAEAFIKALDLEKDPIKMFLYSIGAVYTSNYLALRALTSQPTKK